MNNPLQAGLAEALGLQTEITLLKAENARLQKIIDDAQYLARCRRWPLVQGVLDHAVAPEKSGLPVSSDLDNKEEN